MIRAFALMGLLGALLMAGEYAACCEEKNRLAVVERAGFSFYAVDENRLLYVGKLPRGLPDQWRIVRHDPLFGLTLYEVAHGATPLVFRPIDRIDEHPDRLTLVQGGARFSVRFEQHQEGFTPAQLNRPAQEGAILCAPCYAVMGLGYRGGVIESDLLEHFIHFSGPSFAWGDLGFRLAPGSALIMAVNPFVADNPFLPGDRVVAIDTERVRSAAHAARLLFTRIPGQEAKVRIEREGQEHTYRVPVGERLGGGRYADTFLEHLGWRLDESLTIEVLVHEDVIGRGAMRVGDQLIQINNHVVEDAQSAMALLSGHEGPVKLLLSRDNFHFFIRLGERRERLEEILWR